jgi:hypothetical protein
MDNRLVHKARKFFHKQRKKIYHSIKARNVPRSVLFVVGCQRSGTSIVTDVLNRDLNTKCLGEFNTLTSNDSIGKIRLNSLELVREEFSKIKAPFIVVKPLVESQNTPELLSYFHNSTGLWIFRGYKNVASSNIQYFGMENGVEDLRPIVNNEPNNWRSDKVSDHVRETILKYFSEEMNPYDAAVLFWYARNSIYFDRELDKDPRVMLWYYEDFVLDPEKYLRKIYQKVGQPYPQNKITKEVHSNSRKKGKDIEVSPEIEQLARELQEKLEAAYRKQLF